MLERLDFKSARFDKLADTILINGKRVIVEISRDAFEALYRRDFTGDEVIIKAIEESKRLNHLANVIPADDGKIHITAA
ncbi:MAG: hypothetical protein GY761_14430, partial [Hyphomicrobiales bacterium]|nr:hypothetical protein [Hyphomicrobiales bacterium]